uniref:Uncharacterized protein n=2 Tax=Lotus japonicus TaxID=34305 RepID=I3SR95_LOTJA|nr:unknown [Lotus japonicus]
MEPKESACLPIHGSSLSVVGNQDTSQAKESADLGNLPLPDLGSIEEFGVSGELGGPQDLSSWLNNFDDDGLQEDDCIGLEIPMDDLSDLMLM